ncbi:MAG: hypothetical protein M3O31_10125 [Acidobacteriota bacterium]|nr:hypothetical protein [Acidobacteriota bacterium]
MKILRYLLAFALVAGLSGVAKADDFQMVIIDPLPAPSDINFIFNQSFPVSLSACDSGQLNGLDPKLYLGCFTGLNDTGKVLTSLQIIIPVFGAPSGIGLDQPGCGLAGGGLDIFKNTPTCGFTNSNKDYFVNFTGGNLPTAPRLNGDCDDDRDGIAHGFNADDVPCNAASIFTIAVGFGKDCGTRSQCSQLTDQIVSDFNDNGGVVATANAPEPNSFLLMSTGVLSIGLVGVYRRRQISPFTPRL